MWIKYWHLRKKWVVEQTKRAHIKANLQNDSASYRSICSTKLLFWNISVIPLFFSNKRTTLMLVEICASSTVAINLLVLFSLYFCRSVTVNTFYTIFVFICFIRFSVCSQFLIGHFSFSFVKLNMTLRFCYFFHSKKLFELVRPCAMWLASSAKLRSRRIMFDTFFDFFFFFVILIMRIYKIDVDANSKEKRNRKQDKNRN